MKLAIIQCVNGNYSVVAEGFTEAQAAKVSYHHRCEILWNAADVTTGYVAIVDEQLDVFEGYKEAVFHEPQAAAEE